jgi:predicted alpha/beta-hydrolase family hydrolase
VGGQLFGGGHSSGRRQGATVAAQQRAKLSAICREV